MKKADETNMMTHTFGGSKGESLKCFSMELKRIWETDSHLTCPLIGACLTLEEHRKLLKKCGVKVKGMDDFRLHRYIMIHLNKENRIALKVERYLRHKYSKIIQAFAAIDEEAFFKAWSCHFSSGDMAGLFYVAAMRKDLSEDVLTTIYGQVHMAGHANIKELMQTRRICERRKTAANKTARLLNQEKRQTKKLRREVKRLQASLARTQERSACLHKKSEDSKRVLTEHEKMNGENRQLRQRLENIQAHNDRLKEQLHILEREKRLLEIQHFGLQADNRLLANEIKELIDRLKSHALCTEGCDDQCPRLHLCAKRVLIVGGMTKMKHLYRQLIKAGGGRFEYHDGYMRTGKQSLAERVKRCDIILCPVNCNSHNACRTVKALCKRLNKPVKMLPSAGLSTISEALTTPAPPISASIN